MKKETDIAFPQEGQQSMLTSYGVVIIVPKTPARVPSPAPSQGRRGGPDDQRQCVNDVGTCRIALTSPVQAVTPSARRPPDQGLSLSNTALGH